MTLILTRTSAEYAVMVTDRKVTKNGVEHDLDANKNLIFSDRNSVVVIAYTGHAYIGKTPTDQWIAETLTDLTFPDGRRKGSPPSLMTNHYEQEYIGVRIRKMLDRLNEVRSLIQYKYRNAWTADSFDLIINGFEWNHGEVRPLTNILSKPRKTNTFEISNPDRNWSLAVDNAHHPVRMYALPSENFTTERFQSINARLDASWGDGHGSPGDIAGDSANLLAATIRDVSINSKVVGPDTMSILIPAPRGDNPTIQITYASANRIQGVIEGRTTKMRVPIAFTPWVINPGCIRSPSVITNLIIESPCGPYKVVMTATPAEGGPRVGAMSSQRRQSNR